MGCGAGQELFRDYVGGKVNIYQMARQRIADVDIVATRSHAAEVALAHKAEINRKWRDANPDKVAEMRLRDREREKTPERKAKHKAWAHSPAGKESERRRGAKYYATEKGKANALKKSKAYYERHKADPEFRARKQACSNAWKERNPERAREIRDYSNAVHRGKMKQRRLGGEHVLALMGMTLKVRMVA